MSKLKECVELGFVKEFCDGFVDDFEDVFNCSVNAICVHVVSDEDEEVIIKMHKEI